VRLRFRRASAMMAIFAALAPAAVSSQPWATDYRPARPARLNASERLFDIPLAGGASQRVLLVVPPNALGAIIMLPGGAGDIGLERDGDIRHDDNFVVRTRTSWAARGYAVLIPDTIARENLRGLRSSPAYASLIWDLVGFAHRQINGRVFLLGTSQGSIAAMNGAAHAPAGTVAGVILTESVSVMGGSGETVFDADPHRVHVPALIVANRADRCKVAPPEMARDIARALTASPEVRVLVVSGGLTRSANDCGSLTPHGYLGIEDQVISTVTAWMRAHGR
jgi:pimeloyl-ACP methyl ester carboxylesterase